jgi:hypothetical protein
VRFLIDLEESAAARALVVGELRRLEREGGLVRPLIAEEVLLFLDELRLDPQRRHSLRMGTDLFQEARRAGLIEATDHEASEFRQRAQEARSIGWVRWSPFDAVADSVGGDNNLLNAREFRLTDAGLSTARALKEFPREFLVAKDLDALLLDHGWTGAATEIAAAEGQFRAKHWADAVAMFYAAVESGLKHRLDEAGVKYGDGAALRALARTAVEAMVIPANYQALFGFLDSIRSPRSHGAGAAPVAVEVGPAEAVLMANHARGLLLYLLQRPR